MALIPAQHLGTCPILCSRISAREPAKDMSRTTLSPRCLQDDVPAVVEKMSLLSKYRGQPEACTLQEATKQVRLQPPRLAT